ncbi:MULTISPECIES: helix-hairpin-helix domain-containing protein [Sphingobacterium]|uniref:helix-hairpin-helix domain-containing protein n=1 Tax=Sphingobacterium TaxID=28453 RepID=UPI0013DB2257|nr:MULTISPECIES: helix-hairpin-helix domain-containing protein [unclassified Sphingobacterium]
MKRLFSYFELSLAEQRGFITLSLIVLFLLSIPYLYDAIRKDESLEHEVILFNDLKSDSVYFNRLTGSRPRFLQSKEVDLDEFDPNGLSIERWTNLGLSVKQAQVIKNFESKGGRFRKKEDLSRIYAISEEDYKRLLPYIKINSIADIGHTSYEQGTDFKKKDNVVYPTKERKEVLVDIGNADSTAWVLLKGIGPVLAKRIIKYREALGGFHDVNQIAEVYGLPSETFALIKDKLYLPEEPVKKIKINKTSLNELAKHPYISWKQAQWIINYREQHGFYEDLKSLESIRLLNQDFFRKIEPYLEF